MPTSKIGRKAKMRAKDLGEYNVYGIALTLDGFEIRRFRMKLDQVLAMEVVVKPNDKLDTVRKFQLEMAKYLGEFNQYQIERKRDKK
jgi:hypothetical protein